MEPAETVTDDAGTDDVGTDYRMLVPAAVAWPAAALAVERGPVELVVAACAAAALGALAARHLYRLAAISLFVLAAVVLVTGLRVAASTTGPVADLAVEGAAVQVRLEVTGDPRTIETAYADLVVVRARVTYVEGRGVGVETREPIVIFADETWSRVELGATVQTSGVLDDADQSNTAAVLNAASGYRVVQAPSWWWTAAARMRAAVSESVSTRSDDVAGLVPALVHGDDSRLPDDLDEDFRTSGLTHLLAVSGTNLTLVVGFVLFIARRAGVRGRGLIALGILAIAGFVLLARPEPSVVRAAAMGFVAIAGLGSGGARRGVRSLSWAVIGLLLLDPWLARTAGFILSVCATLGILVLAPPWRDRLARWMPRWCAEALSVPLAAQLACTPIVAAISGQVSFVAVAANVLVAPAVGPATVLGLLGGLVVLISTSAGHIVGWVTGLFAGWIVTVGHRAADLPGASTAWSSTTLGVAGLAVLCVLIGAGCFWALHRPLICLPIVVLVVVGTVRPVSVGWPPADWVMVMCDVGQGDAIALNAGHDEAVVIDTGPEPRSVDGCLDDLGVDAVPLVVLTHDHADHTGGLSGVLADREVGSIGSATHDLPVPPGVRVIDLDFGARQTIGDVSWTVIGPAPGVSAVDAATSDGTSINNTSVVLLAEVRGIRILLTGDVEPKAQAALLDATRDLDVDVLKVPHHGSASQDPGLFEEVDAEYALISVGADNDYGHPAPDVLDLARNNGMRVVRTDRSGDIAVVSDSGVAEVVTH
ncbi:MAG: ComEC/Rec2 family competence protein [Actinomycetia bacterium]|nr:ComEC/Rec2 family competence protein [Actinomycetes bacterium]